MDRGDTVIAFRSRLAEAMERAGVNRSSLAKRIGVDRSTLSQLMSPENDRLPRADTVGAIAVALQVSADWLLGLTQDEQLGADILEQSVQMQPRKRSRVDENLRRWYAETAGYKIRYVPTNLPDHVKIEEVIAHEHGEDRSVDQAMIRARDRLDYTRRPETDVEICTPIQHLRSFARGEDIWDGLSLAIRAKQLAHIVALVDELYPSLRWFLYDGLPHYAVPVTIFGPVRAAVFAGDMYFVFNTTEHIRTLTRQFDQLIRQALVQPHETAAYAQTLLGELDAGAKTAAA